MSTYTYKLLGALLGVAAGVTLFTLGLNLPEDDSRGMAAVATGSGIIGAASAAIYTNGRKGTDQP